ncbi:hypothetical protein V6R21_32335 [Limibacter armeniacum]|uniref:hypothetical protein n=1 Tax=Limibacter armeniacum TaxID=466084 RepID=UPI002FE65045
MALIKVMLLYFIVLAFVSLLGSLLDKKKGSQNIWSYDDDDDDYYYDSDDDDSE